MMKKALSVLLFLFLGYSLQAQEYFLGKSQKFIMDSLSKTNYTRFNGQIAKSGQVTTSGQIASSGEYLVNFSYEIPFDTSTTIKKGASEPFTVEIDTTHATDYSFVFDHNGICVSTITYHTNLTDYYRVITELNSNYKVESKDKVWIDSLGQVEVVITKNKYQPGFYVDYRKVKK